MFGDGNFGSKRLFTVLSYSLTLAFGMCVLSLYNFSLRHLISQMYRPFHFYPMTYFNTNFGLSIYNICLSKQFLLHSAELQIGLAVKYIQSFYSKLQKNILIHKCVEIYSAHHIKFFINLHLFTYVIWVCIVCSHL